MKSTPIIIKNLKTGPSREYGPNGAYTATVYFNNKRTLSIFEAGDGGSVHYPAIYDMDAKKEMFAWIATEIQPQERYKEYSLEAVVDIYLGDLVNIAQEERNIKKVCKNKVVVKLKSVPNGHVVYKCRFTKLIAGQIQEQCGDDLIEIVNYRYACPI